MIFFKKLNVILFFYIYLIFFILRDFFSLSKTSQHVFRILTLLLKNLKYTLSARVLMLSCAFLHHTFFTLLNIVYLHLPKIDAFCQKRRMLLTFKTEEAVMVVEESTAGLNFNCKYLLTPTIKFYSWILFLRIIWAQLFVEWGVCFTRFIVTFFKTIIELVLIALVFSSVLYILSFMGLNTIHDFILASFIVFTKGGSLKTLLNKSQGYLCSKRFYPGNNKPMGHAKKILDATNKNPLLPTPVTPPKSNTLSTPNTYNNTNSSHNSNTSNPVTGNSMPKPFQSIYEKYPHIKPQNNQNIPSNSANTGIKSIESQQNNNNQEKEFGMNKSTNPASFGLIHAAKSNLQNHSNDSKTFSDSSFHKVDFTTSSTDQKLPLLLTEKGENQPKIKADVVFPNGFPSIVIEEEYTEQLEASNGKLVPILPVPSQILQSPVDQNDLQTPVDNQVKDQIAALLQRGLIKKDDFNQPTKEFYHYVPQKPKTSLITPEELSNLSKSPNILVAFSKMDPLGNTELYHAIQTHATFIVTIVEDKFVIIAYATSEKTNNIFLSDYQPFGDGEKKGQYMHVLTEPIVVSPSQLELLVPEHLRNTFTQEEQIRQIALEKGTIYLQKPEIKKVIEEQFIKYTIPKLSESLSTYTGEGFTSEDIDYTINSFDQAQRIDAKKLFDKKYISELNNFNADNWMEKMSFNKKHLYPYLVEMANEYNSKHGHTKRYEIPKKIN